MKIEVNGTMLHLAHQEAKLLNAYDLVEWAEEQKRLNRSREYVEMKYKSIYPEGYRYQLSQSC